MPRVQALAVVILLLSYGAVGARQPAVRVSVPLPAPAARLAEALELPVADRSRIVLDIVRLIFDSPPDRETRDTALRARLDALIQAGPPGEPAPLPLDPAIWREAILERDVPDAQVLGAILSDRRTALLYHGLAALDDETLGWLGAERGVVRSLLEHAGAFAYSARSLQVRAGRVVVPGGPEAEPVWDRLIGAHPSRPAPFVRQLFSSSKGYLAFFYDTVAQLDEPRQRFALAHGRPAKARADHMRALSKVFERTFGELRLDERPFARQPADPVLMLSTIVVDAGGNPVGPSGKRLWEIVFRGDALGPAFGPVEPGDLRSNDGAVALDAAWLAGRIFEHGMATARRRLDAFLFGQRVFRHASDVPDAATATALRGMLAFPALMLTLERCGVTSPRTLADAAARAHALNGMGSSEARREALTLFQASLGIIDRAVTTGGLSRPLAAESIASLLAVDLSGRESSRQIANWLRRSLLPVMADGHVESGGMESSVLAALAGARGNAADHRIVEWEGRRYRVSPSAAELARLRAVRERQLGASLDEALAPGTFSGGDGNDDPHSVSLADVLVSILYAAHIGDPHGRLLAADNVALRHDLAFEASGRARPLAPWRFAVEVHGRTGGWRLFGSLLGLDVPLSRFTLRRLDLTTMPPAPRLTSNEAQTAALTVTLMRPGDLTDDVRDEIAAAVKRGRARLAGLRNDRGEIVRLARDAGLSEWRREALAWALENDPAQVDSPLSLLELMWVGAPRPSAAASLDRWGAAVTPLTGCLCLGMPAPAPWESLGGRPSVGLLATRGVDVTILLAEEFSDMQLPAALIPGVLKYAMQDALDAAQPAYFDDWSEFGRAARTLSRERLIDFVAALTSGGPLLPLETDDRN